MNNTEIKNIILDVLGAPKQNRIFPDYLDDEAAMYSDIQSEYSVSDDDLAQLIWATMNTRPSSPIDSQRPAQKTLEELSEKYGLVL